MFNQFRAGMRRGLLVGFLVFGAMPAVQAEGWSDHRRLEVARSHLSATTFNGEIYVAGGAGLIGPQDVFELYDPIADFWVPLPSLPGGREQFGMTSAAGRIYMSGGFTAEANGGAGDDFWSFDPNQLIWQAEPKMPGARAGHTLAAAGNSLYVIGGSGGGTSSTLVFDVETRKWRTIGAIPGARSGVSSITIGNKIYVLGGLSNNGQVSRRVDILNASSETWSRGPDMPKARAGAALGLLNGEIHVAGGATFNPRQTHADHFILNPSTGAWRNGLRLPTPRYAGAGATIGDRWFVMGGGAGSGLFVLFTAVDAVESYGP